MRVKVIVSSNLELNQYEAEAIVYQQVVQKIGGQLMQVPGIVVRLDSGELKVQPLQMDLHVVQVFEVKKEESTKEVPLVVEYVVDFIFKVTGEYYEPIKNPIDLVSTAMREFLEISAYLPEPALQYKAKNGLNIEVLSAKG